MNLFDTEKAFDWSKFLPHKECWNGDLIPNRPGLYQVRRLGEKHLDYIGQTGKGTMTLRKRLGMLSGIYGAEMPYTAPHTAGPALWALRQQSNVEFEVSVFEVNDSTQKRKGLEALAVALHRQQFGKSPSINFGRMPRGFCKSSANTSGLRIKGKRFRGGQCDSIKQYHATGIPPVGPITSDNPHSSRWGGHEWSDWRPLDRTSIIPMSATGIYRIRDAIKPGLLYIGEGIVRDRLISHFQKAKKSHNAQSDIFGAAERLECSWVFNQTWLPHHRLELECDLIGAHLLFCGAAPSAQFIG